MSMPLDPSPDRDRPLPRPVTGKALQFALVMLAACVVLSLGIGMLLTPMGGQRASTAVSPRAIGAAPAKVASKSVNNARVYHADASGHFFVDAAVNGTNIRFLVDTGATVVALTRNDARAIGLSDGELSFTETMGTANGAAHAARTTLRSVRLDQFETSDVPAVVMEKDMAISLLGMSFLSRVAGYSISGGDLTIEW